MTENGDLDEGQVKWPNRFRALENVNDSDKEEKVSDANLGATIENALKSAMEEAVACTKGSRAKKGQTLNVSKNDMSMIGEIVAHVMVGVEPLITSVVTSAVTACDR